MASFQRASAFFARSLASHQSALHLQVLAATRSTFDAVASPQGLVRAFATEMPPKRRPMIRFPVRSSSNVKVKASTEEGLASAKESIQEASRVVSQRFSAMRRDTVSETEMERIMLGGAEP